MTSAEVKGLMVDRSGRFNYSTPTKEAGVGYPHKNQFRVLSEGIDLCTLLAGLAVGDGADPTPALA